MFKKISFLSLMLGVAVLGFGLEETDISVDIVQKGRVETNAFFVEELVAVEDGVPILRASFGKIRIEDGKFIKRLFLPREERFLHNHILRSYSTFRLYVDETNVGIFTYQPYEMEKKKRKKGFYFKALPFDKDAGLKRITKNVKEKASLESLLDMNLEDAMQTADKETIMDSAFDKMMDIELGVLKKVDGKKKGFAPFLVVTKEAGK